MRDAIFMQAWLNEFPVLIEEACRDAGAGHNSPSGVVDNDVVRELTKRRIAQRWRRGNEVVAVVSEWLRASVPPQLNACRLEVRPDASVDERRRALMPAREAPTKRAAEPLLP